MTYEDIYPGVRNFIVKEISKTPIGNGRYHREYSGMDYLPTPKFGLLSEDEWLRFAMQAIEENEDLDLFQAILNHVSNLAFMKRAKERDRRLYAAECLVHGSWKVWAKRGDFQWPTI